MALEYNPIENRFVEYQAIENPIVKKIYPLIDDELDFSDWASSIKDDGTITVKPNLSTMTIDNNPEVEITNSVQQNSVQQNSVVSSNLKNNQKKAMEFFINKGLSNHAAAGIVGNLMTESKLKTDAIGDKGTSYGLAQWHNERWANLKKFAKKRGTHESDINTQLEFLWHELSTEKRFKGLIDQLNNSRNSDEATILFMNKFEVPSEQAKLQSSKQRRQNAASLLS